MEQVKTAEVVEETAGLPYEQMDKLMEDMLGGRQVADAAENRRAPAGVAEWDELTLLTGGFVPVGSIFWARPPKIFSQQRILLAIDEAETVQEGEKPIAAVVRQSNILINLSAELFFVREGGDFRPATKQELGGDEVGLSVTELKESLLRLMNINPEGVAEGNAESLPTS
jgi:hypothetical protein